MPDEIIRDAITVGAVPSLPGHPGSRGEVQTLRANGTQEAVAGGRTSWYGNVPRTLPYAFDDLTSDFGDDIYAKMMLDPQVNACIGTLKTAVLADGVTVVPAILDQTQRRYAKAQEIADFVSECIDNLNPSIDVVLWDMLDALAYGAKVAEQVYTLKNNTLALASLKVKPRRNTAFVVDAFMNTLGLLALIPGQAAGTSVVTQIVVDPKDAPNMLPRDKFAIFTNWPHDSDPRGTSLLRPAYRPWWDKQQMVPEYLRYLTQFASASIIATAPDGAQTPASLPDSPDVMPLSLAQQIAKALGDFRNGTFVVLPYGSTAKPIEVSGEGVPFMHAFDRFDSQISTAILHQTLATQEAKHDTRAAAQVHQDILALLVRMTKRAVARMLRQDVFYPLVAYNFGEAAARQLTPSTNLSEVEAEDVSARMTAISALANAGLILPSQLPDIYADLSLPPASPDDLKVFAESFNAPPAPPAPPQALPVPQPHDAPPAQPKPAPPAHPPTPAPPHD